MVQGMNKEAIAYIYEEVVRCRKFRFMVCCSSQRDMVDMGLENVFFEEAGGTLVGKMSGSTEQLFGPPSGEGRPR